MTEPLQFDAAEPAGPAGAPAALECSSCKVPITGAYHMLNQVVLCERCRHNLERQWNDTSATSRLAPALLLGLGAAAAGWALWYAIIALLDMQIGLVAIAVGWLVGRAVRKGSGERGGLPYQVMAVVLTYLAIAAVWFVLILRQVEGDVSLVTVAIFALRAPFYGGVSRIMGWIIVVVALYEAWVLNKPAVLQFSGPYKVGAATT